MSGICSRHHDHDPNCDLCGKTPADIFGEESWAHAVAEAEAAGKHTCEGCGFVYYKTVDACPRCGAVRVQAEGDPTADGSGAR